MASAIAFSRVFNDTPAKNSDVSGMTVNQLSDERTRLITLTEAFDAKGDKLSSQEAQQYADAVQVRFDEAGSRVKVGVDSVNGNTVFTIRDAETGQVIRKIPSDEAIRISQNIDRLTGLYVDRIE